MCRTRYIFIDYENVCESDLFRVAGKTAVVFLILGLRQEKLPVQVTLFAQRNPDQLRILQTKVEGHNALDLVLALEVGRQLAADPGGSFYIISKDRDYESVVRHLKAENRSIARHKSLREIPAFRTSGEAPAVQAKEDRLTRFLQQLRDGRNRPSTRAKLENHIKAAFGNLTEPEFIGKIIDRLLSEKILTFADGGRITYTHAA